MEYAGIIVLGLSCCGALYAGVATWVMGHYLKRPMRAAPQRPSVSILKPLNGDEPGLYENLSSFLVQDYAAQIQIVMGAQDPADPALAVAQSLRRDYPGQDATVIADPTLHGTNRKISNLINLATYATGEIIVISDSDVRMPRDGIDKIVAALSEPGVGLVYCLYRGRPSASLWSSLAALDINTRFAASVMVGEALGAHPCLGPTMALRADVLQQIGGLEHLRNVLADDFELGRAVRAAGYGVACPPMVIDHVFPESHGRQMLAHELRWARTIRLIEPAGYLGSVITHFTPLALIGCAMAGFAPWSLAALAGLHGLRFAQAYVMTRLLGAEQRHLWLVPVRDMASFWVFLAAIFGDRVEWRGNHLRVGRDGAITAA